ncbi:hypothetical protein V6N13_004459 [Hibiscus sabdariffa]|uniref:CNNM transmembrane domain-containing protein n=1 Tax=Hibiscus sabdariffa TaxID=183260 RepID=A0ABR2RZ98_9ROSI
MVLFALVFIGEAFLFSTFGGFFHGILESLPNLFATAELDQEHLQKLKILMLTKEKALGNIEEKQIVNSRVQELVPLEVRSS